MRAVFIELPAFARCRADYLDDAAFGMLQQAFMKNPESGEVIEGTGGLRKFWLYTLYDKDEASDLTPKERKAFKEILKMELESRRVA